MKTFERDLELPCQEHKENTCCMGHDIKRIYADMSRIGWGKPIKAGEQADCRRLSETVMCYVCDGAVGIGKRKGLCAPLCQQWYEACQQ